MADVSIMRLERELSLKVGEIWARYRGDIGEI